MTFDLPLTEPAGIFSVVLLIILVAPFAAEKLRMPGIIGLALAGILVGPHGLGLISDSETIEFLGSIGLIYVFFLAGAELDVGQLRRERRSTLVFTAFTLLLPFAVGFASGRMLFGLGTASAVLFGCLFSSYTLVAYPIVSKLGISRERSVATAVSSVILTDTATMIVLAAVARYARGGDDPGSWAILAASILAWATLSAFLLPRAAALFFKKVQPDGTIEFVFIFALAFACAFASRLAGLEPIIGAFYAGLLLNRFIPQSGVLMNRIKFMGDSLFVPFFMVYIGVIAAPGDVFGDLGHLAVAVAMVALNLASKWLAAGGAALVLKYTGLERTMLFGLSVSHAAAV
ncbi:MAG: cation:proton antiporter, partial [Spirochaetaceae bacterium]|nr:cation:proton antiporter [Spirochaetaceae bacterium]